MSKGQASVTITVIMAIVGFLGFVGGGTYVSKGQAQVEKDVSVLQSESSRYRGDIAEINSAIKDIQKTQSLQGENLAAIGAALGVKIKK